MNEVNERQVQSAVSSRPLHVMWVGFRGFPQVQGGIEAHAEQLCTRLVQAGCQVTAVTRSPYMQHWPHDRWQGVRLQPLWTPRHRALEAFVHTGLAVLVAGLWWRPDVLHLQAIGPALWAPVARALGLKVVMTHHGADYERQKWGGLARWALRRGEAWGARWAQAVVVISPGIAAHLQRLHGRDSELIPNGLSAQDPPAPDPAVLDRFGLQPGRYVVMVARLVPEKRHLDLIEAFKQAALPGWKLVLVGGADHGSGYAEMVDDCARNASSCVLAGFQTGAALHTLVSQAGVFVLPSSHEGQPIALLEALACGLPVLASDIPAHRELHMPWPVLFPLGDVPALTQALRRQARRGLGTEAQREARRHWARSRFDWDHSARQTLRVYQAVVSGGSVSVPDGT